MKNDFFKELLTAVRLRLKEKEIEGSTWTFRDWLLKLGEEYGELCETYTKSKPEKNQREEICDVIIVALILATINDMNLEKELRSKFNEVSVRKGSIVRL